MSRLLEIPSAPAETIRRASITPRQILQAAGPVVERFRVQWHHMCRFCLDSYDVETDAFSDGGMQYYVEFMARRQEGRPDE